MAVAHESCCIDVRLNLLKRYKQIQHLAQSGSVALGCSRCASPCVSGCWPSFGVNPVVVPVVVVGPFVRLASCSTTQGHA